MRSEDTSLKLHDNVRVESHLSPGSTTNFASVAIDANLTSSTTTKTTNMSTMITPRPMDVRLGRGKSYSIHLGNTILHELVSTYRTEYADSSNLRKREIAIEILNTIEASGGRFIKQSVSETWSVVSKETARQKVAHAMQYCIRSSDNRTPEKHSTKAPTVAEQPTTKPNIQFRSDESLVLQPNLHIDSVSTFAAYSCHPRMLICDRGSCKDHFCHYAPYLPRDGVYTSDRMCSDDHSCHQARILRRDGASAFDVLTNDTKIITSSGHVCCDDHSCHRDSATNLSIDGTSAFDVYPCNPKVVSSSNRIYHTLLPPQCKTSPLQHYTAARQVYSTSLSLRNIMAHRMEREQQQLNMLGPLPLYNRPPTNNHMKSLQLHNGDHLSCITNCNHYTKLNQSPCGVNFVSSFSDEGNCSSISPEDEFQPTMQSLLHGTKATYATLSLPIVTTRKNSLHRFTSNPINEVKLLDLDCGPNNVHEHEIPLQEPTLIRSPPVPTISQTNSRNTILSSSSFETIQFATIDDECDTSITTTPFIDAIDYSGIGALNEYDFAMPEA